MDELDDNQQARLFDALLSDAEKWQTPPRAQARRAAQADEAVAEDLSLVVSLRQVNPSHHEVEKARARVAEQLAALMRAEPSAPRLTRAQAARAWLRAITSPPAPSAQQALRAQRKTVPARRAQLGASLSRFAMVAVALLALLFGLLAGASAASAQALPESPLYGVKRGEESILLTLSWTADSKGQTLAMIANHRIVEAIAEADQNRPAEARSLLGKFDSALSQLIDLTAQQQASHADSSSLARAVQTTLETEQSAASQAARHGETSFAQAAAAGAQAAMAHILRVGITLPNKTGVGNGAGNSSGHGNGGSTNSNGNSGGNGVSKPQQTPADQATHTPHPNSGSSNSGNENGGSAAPPPIASDTPIPSHG